MTFRPTAVLFWKITLQLEILECVSGGHKLVLMGTRHGFNRHEDQAMVRARLENKFDTMYNNLVPAAGGLVPVSAGSSLKAGPPSCH